MDKNISELIMEMAKSYGISLAESLLMEHSGEFTDEEMKERETHLENNFRLLERMIIRAIERTKKERQPTLSMVDFRRISDD